MLPAESATAVTLSGDEQKVVNYLATLMKEGHDTEVQDYHVSLNVKNVGPRAGDEVVQLYVREVTPRERRAVKALRGIERLTLKPGETRHASFTLVPDKDFTHYDVEHKRYAVNGGSYELQVGASSSDIRLKSNVVVNNP